MKKDNYTPEELTDLLQTQVVLTLINDGEFYRKAYDHIKRHDYQGFCNEMTSEIRAVASDIVPEADFLPATRSRVLTWGYYMQDKRGWNATDKQYLTDMRQIANNDRDFLDKPGVKPGQPDPGTGYVLITPEQAAELKFTAEYYSTLFTQWKSCRNCVFASGYVYRAPAYVMQQLSPLPSTSPETPKEITMSTTTATFDATTPVTNVTLIYGKPAKSYSESDLLACVRRLDADIETYEKSATGSARIAAKVATMKAERDQIIQAFDAAAESSVPAATV